MNLNALKSGYYQKSTIVDPYLWNILQLGLSQEAQN